LSFVCRSATDYFELILHPALLLKVFISYSSLVEYLGSLMLTVISSANSDTLTSSCSIYIPFIFFSCLIALARTSILYLIDIKREDRANIKMYKELKKLDIKKLNNPIKNGVQI
jgi:ABC-type transport system involved in multi-copper enzyme maturation permease subunit